MSSTQPKGLQRFIPYFGGKSDSIDKYPKPRYPLIIEPFAGGASYARRYYHKSVELYDTYEPLIEVWHYLQNSSQADVLKLGRVKKGQRVENILQRWWACQATRTPARQVTTWSEKEWNRAYGRIAAQAQLIKHWKVELKDYREIENREATWFIDPPYQHQGSGYPHSNLDYDELADWCRSRKGQVIVCEGIGADWLPFKMLGRAQVSTYNKRKNFSRKIKPASYEMIWTNDS